MKKRKKIFLLSVLAIVSVAIFVWVSIKPTNDADWSLDQKVLAYSEVQDNLVQIHNIRNFKYNTETDYIPGYYDKTFDLDKISSVSFAVAPYTMFGLNLAHTFVTFGFDDGRYVSVSIEIRKKAGQSFSPLGGLFKQYELMYVIADENDVIKLRSNYRHEDVHLYPIKARKEKIKELFLSMLDRANQLKNKPEFYDLFTNTCTTNIVDHVNIIAPKKIPFSFKVLFPGKADKLAYDLGMIDTDLPFEEAKAKYLINERALKYADDPNFSAKIRDTSL